MEKMLKEILGKLDNLESELTEFKQQTNQRFDKIETNQTKTDQRLERIETQQSEMNSRLDRLETQQSEMNFRLDRLETQQSEMNSRLDRLETQQSEMNSRLDRIETQQSENTQLIQALLHASEVHKADIDNLTHQVAQLSQEMKAGFKELTEVSKSLLEMYGEHEAEIRTIKRRV
ncbi:MAG: Uncharacterized protein XD63_1377 [Thermoanaerobacterales bacterium 50_218]|nr:MAG: Uncharacterized protein XD63_1377 [Thermoanaerobacterales bacterium 50_218]HAA90778.1 hypothetical protein [Peptococcaceae bacterium]